MEEILTRTSKLAGDPEYKDVWIDKAVNRGWRKVMLDKTMKYFLTQWIQENTSFRKKRRSIEIGSGLHKRNQTL